MTISSTNRKAGPYAGNDVAVAFPFSFKVFGASDLYVVRADLTGIETVLTLAADYTVTLNSNQDSNPGGTITLSGALASIYTLTIASHVQNLQPTDLTNQGGFYPKVITNALDKLTILIQQLAETVSRSLKTAISTPAGVGTQLPAPVANTIIGWNSTANGFKNYAPVDNTLLSAALAAPSGGGLIGGLNWMTYPSQNILGYGRNWFDVSVPAVTDFIDNVFSVQNKSHGSGVYGNAAISFLDGAGTERGAIGYSRNNAIQPTGYYANTLYCEIGNPFTTDAQFTHFRVINTVKAGSASWGGSAKSYFPIEILSDTGAISFNNGGGTAPILFVGPAVAAQGLAVGDLSYGTPVQHSVAMTTTAARFREYGAANQFALTSNVSNLNPAAITKDVAGGSAWKIEYGVGFDRFQVSRCASGASTWSDFFTIGLDGTAYFSKQIRSQIAPSAGWAVSVDDTLPVTVNNGATYSLAPSAGLVMLNDYTGGQAAVFLCSAGNVVLISQTGTQYVVGAPGAGKVGLVWTGSAYQISNNKGANTTFGVMTFATRQTN